jgi:hypothetical protein
VSRRSRFTRQQRLVLIGLGSAVVVVLSLLGYSVATTLPLLSTPISVGYTPPPLSPLQTAVPGSPAVTPTLAPTPTPSPTPTPTATPISLSQIDSARVVNELSRIVARVRDLPAVEQIPVSFPTAREVTIALLQRYQEEQPQQALSLYMTLGLIPPLDPLPLPDVVAQANHISSLYLPVEREVLLVTGRGPTTPEDELAAVHSLARAIQDQQFDLGTLIPCQASTDAQLALRALVEGDTILTAALYANPELDDAELDRLATMAASAQEPAYASLNEDGAFQRLWLFPYAEGTRLVAATYEEGGWGAVNRAYARPPCSTNQVLHPGPTLSQEPIEWVALPDLGPTLGDDWSLLRRDTIGELLIGLHVAEYVEDDEAVWDIVAAWAGDTFVQWESEEGEQLLAWRIAWDDRASAEAFVDAYTLLVPRFRTPPLINADTPLRLPGRLWEGPAGAAHVARAGRTVTIVWGPDVETVTALAERLP